MAGLAVVVVVLALATGAGLLLRRRQGKFTTFTRTSRADSPASPLSAPANVLTTADLGAPLGERATLVQFSTELCANCPATRRLLTQVAAEHDGVEFVEVDAAARLDLTRRLNVLSTPTVFVLSPDGAIASRASGQQRKADVLGAVSRVLAGAPASRGAGQ